MNENCFESFWKEWSGIQPWQKIIEQNPSDGTYKHVDLLVSARCVVGICVHLFHRRFSFQHHVPNATILRTWSQFWENEFKWKSSSHLFQVRCNRQLLPRFVSLLLPKKSMIGRWCFFWGDGLAAMFRGFKYCWFSPLPGEMIQFEYFFQMGWNHQLVLFYQTFISFSGNCVWVSKRWGQTTKWSWCAKPKNIYPPWK